MRIKREEGGMVKALAFVLAIPLGILVGHFFPTILAVLTGIIVAGVVVATISQAFNWEFLGTVSSYSFMFLVAAWITRIRE